MGAAGSGAGQRAGHGEGAGASSAGAKVQVTLEDLDLPPRKDAQQAAAAAALAQAMGLPMPAVAGSQPGAGPGAAAQLGGAAAQAITEEIFPGCDPRGQRAFREDGLVGTEGQQLQLLAYYAELCEDFRLYQRGTRAEGAPRESDGAQLLLLSGPPGTGKTRHAVSFARALGLPLLAARPPAPGGSTGSAGCWAAQLRREVRGRDCAVFFDEIDQHVSDEGFASSLRQFLDGVCQPNDSRVLLVGTTNRLERLPADVLHRAEVIGFDRPEREHLAEMWRGYATHLRDDELQQLASTSAASGATGRDVRHCASLCERRTAIGYLNAQSGQGYCHGAALANCPGPVVEQYIRCVKGRAQ